MDDPAPVRTRTSRTAAAAAPARRPWRLIAGVVAAVVVLAVGAYFLLRPKPDDPFGMRVDMPASEPTGDPVRVAYGVRAGDRFTTKIDSKARVALDADYARPDHGMRLEGRLTVSHETEATPQGDLRTRLRWKLDDASSDIPGQQSLAYQVLGEKPVERTLLRDQTGRPGRLEMPPGPSGPLQATYLDLLLSGFSDPTLSYLPHGRDVRVGEAWSLFDEVADFPGLEYGVRMITDTAGEGFPLLVRAGVVKADGLETRGGEETLRLQIVVSLSMEGDTNPPAIPGRVRMAGRGLGTVWISLATGLPVESELTTDLRSRFDRTDLTPVERNAKQVVKTTTVRAE
jgi:hypothetical protein